MTAGEIYTELPAKIEVNAKYVFYSHGFIVEGTNERPVHKAWGVYDFPAVKKALVDKDHHLIAFHRAKKTEPYQYAKSLANQVRKLIKAGVGAENITVMGFSRGGAITIATSNELANSKVNFIILAGCGGFIAKNPAMKLHGRVLSIYETSDQVGSCQYVVDRSKAISTFEEIAISTGKSHGAFYRPIDEWLTPVKQWLKR